MALLGLIIGLNKPEQGKIGLGKGLTTARGLRIRLSLSQRARPPLKPMWMSKVEQSVGEGQSRLPGAKSVGILPFVLTAAEDRNGSKQLRHRAS